MLLFLLLEIFINSFILEYTWGTQKFTELLKTFF